MDFAMKATDFKTSGHMLFFTEPEKFAYFAKNL